jgi:hypothetical protein
MTKKHTATAKGGLDIFKLLVRQVSGLVNETADELVKSQGGNVMQWQADIYHALAVNCDAAAQMSKAFAPQLDKPKKRKAA